MSSAIFEHRGPWHFDELVELPDDRHRYEVVDGALVVSPPPSQLHQRIGAGLLAQLVVQCPPEWRVVYEFAVPMGADGRVADLAVIRADAPTSRPGHPYPAGPEYVGLVVEVVSESSRKTDRFAKPGEYAEAGIGLFWRVETEPRIVVLAHRLENGSYVEAARVDGQGDLPVPWGVARIAVGTLLT